MIARPALPAVLAALTDLGDAEGDVLSGRVTAWRLDDRGVHFRWDGVPYFALYPTRDPAEAWEILDARGLLPPDGAREFWCTPCDSGRSDRGFMGCPACALTGNRRAPATIPDLVAWASLGADAIVTAEALCREIVPDFARLGYSVPRCERVVWQVSSVPREFTRALPVAAGALRTTLRVTESWTVLDGDDTPVLRAIQEAGLALKRVGAECVLCVPPIGGAT